MTAKNEDRTVTLLLNQVEFIMAHREIKNRWDQIAKDCGWQGTEADWRRVALTIQGMLKEAVSADNDEWVYVYVPNVMPPMALKVEH